MQSNLNKTFAETFYFISVAMHLVSPLCEISLMHNADIEA